MIQYYDDLYLDSSIDHGVARSMRNNPDIREWCREHSDISMAQQLRWAEKIKDDPALKMFAIRALRTVAKGQYTGSVYKGGEPMVMKTIDEQFVQVGVCGLTSIDRQNRSAEFSCYIGQEYQRKGYARKALVSLFKHGFDDWGFHRIWGETFDGNPALKLFQEIGMKKVGTHRQAYWKHGKFIDAHIIDILAEEFNGDLR